ncbi:hypothetical protein [Mammaliicoccus sp. Dog046]|uniref:hypothetical protein n=1 Tax=Mammaliicoccus sp. Dog046 TaxID=3034233 RepID=UPI002B25E0AE|nr:hypothetical protein [Mammaliicoccus sp. Dog046]WQK84507.1 hypothetical protein P3U32_07635 [Mammaliicoccus sp. Dog046]
MTCSVNLRDTNFKESNVQCQFEFIQTELIDDIKHYHYLLHVSYDRMQFEKEIVFFENEIESLDINHFTNNSPDFYFYEPDFWFTIFRQDEDELIVYLNFDSGLIHSNMATESGQSVRMNTTVEAFNTFLHDLKTNMK